MKAHDAGRQTPGVVLARQTQLPIAKQGSAMSSDMQAIVSLQRTVGNAAVGQVLWEPAVRHHLWLQRLALDLPAGGAVGDPPATNHREGVMLVLNRLHELWAIENADYDATYPTVAALAPGDAVTDRGALKTIQAALTRLDEPTLAAPVAAAQFALTIGGGVGRGQPNNPSDVAALQDLLHVHWHLTNEAYDREHRVATAGGALNESTLPDTFIGITKLKRAAAAGTGKEGWAPL